MKLLKRAIKSIFGASNVPFYIDSDTKRTIYPNKWQIEQGITEVSHIVLTDKYPDAKILVEYFNLDPAKVVFFVRTDKAEIPYSNPIAILNDMEKNTDEVFVNTSEYLSLDTYLHNVKIPYRAYRRDRHDFGDIIQISGGNGNVKIRETLNSIFSFPTEISLLQSMFGKGERELPKNLVKYLSKLEVTEKNSPIFHALVCADKSFLENLKAFEGKYREIKVKSTEDVLNEEMFFDLLASKLPEFARVWEIEKRREKFISSNGLDMWFLTELQYFPYSGHQSSYFDNKSVKNTFKYLIFALFELYDVFLPAMLKGKFDFSKKAYPGYHFGNYRAKQNSIQQFFEITHILDEIDDDKKISFVNMSSEKLVKDQIEIDCDVVIVKLPLIDSENKELSDELRKKAEESFHKGLKTLRIETKVYFFWKILSDPIWGGFFDTKKPPFWGWNVRWFSLSCKFNRQII